MNFKERLQIETPILFDGAMGTMLQKAGLKLGEYPDTLNITHPETVQNVHRAYLKAGCDIVLTNTFGCNPKKMKKAGYTVDEIVSAAVKNAREAIGNEEKYIALDIGPLGEMLEPIGTLRFEEAVALFAEQVKAGVKAGADFILIETMTDLYEIKAAVLAAKENSELSVLATMSFDENMRTFTGCEVKSMVSLLSSMGVDGLGVNCSLGPDKMEPIVDMILKHSPIPVVVQPNAGLPVLEGGDVIYDMTPEKYGFFIEKFLRKGVRVIGGCCGTDERYIALMRELIDTTPQDQKPELVPLQGVCSPTQFVDTSVVQAVGERMNPTGKKRYQEALKNNEIDYILNEALAQVDKGADILDVNAGLPQVDEELLLPDLIQQIQAVVSAPLQIDTSNLNAAIGAMRVYNGKPILNSVNGEKASLKIWLPQVKKYGASFIGLTLDEKGLPETAEQRFQIAERIVNAALALGIAKEDIYIDCLCLTVSAQQKQGLETLKAMAMVKERLGVGLALGVSNVSFGLPNRETLNVAYLTMAMTMGVNLPIVNPLSENIMGAIHAYRVLSGQDKNSEKYIAQYANQAPAKSGTAIQKSSEGEEDIETIIIKGLKDKANFKTKQLLFEFEPLEIVNKFLIPALDKVGDGYEKGTLFLPQLISSAETVKIAFDVIKDEISKSGQKAISKGKIIVATVKGDVHDIGKNIVKVILENYGFQVIDLGRNVDPQVILQTAQEEDVKLVGLSALMTTTVKSMEETIALLRKEKPDTLTFVGGAVLNEEYANQIGADYFAKDATASAEIAKMIFSKEE